MNWKDGEGRGVAYFMILYLRARTDRIHVNLFKVSRIKNVIKIKQEKETGKDPIQSKLTFSHHASYTQDRRSATPQNVLFIYLVNRYII